MTQRREVMAAMANRVLTTLIRLWNSKPPLELMAKQPEYNHLFIDVHGTRTKVSSAVFEWNWRDLHQLLLELNEPSPTFAAVALYAYQVNFGGDPPGFAEFVASLAEDHIWTTEYAVANLAWNIPRTNGFLDLFQTREAKTDNCDELDELEGLVRYLSLSC